MQLPQLPEVIQPSRPMLGKIAIGIVAVIALSFLWPFYSVPTGSRGVITQFGLLKPYFKGYIKTA